MAFSFVKLLLVVTFMHIILADLPKCSTKKRTQSCEDLDPKKKYLTCLLTCVGDKDYDTATCEKGYGKPVLIFDAKKGDKVVEGTEPYVEEGVCGEPAATEVESDGLVSKLGKICRQETEGTGGKWPSGCTSPGESEITLTAHQNYYNRLSDDFYLKRLKHKRQKRHKKHYFA